MSLACQSQLAQRSKRAPFTLRSSFNALSKSALMTSLIVGSIHTAFAGEPTEAIMATNAQTSLLLDVEQAGNHLVAVGERGHILVSDDQGQSWAQSNVPQAQMLTAVDFPSGNVGFAVGHDSNVVRSDDSGKTWILVRPGLEAQKSINEQSVKDIGAEIRRVQSLIDAGATEDTVVDARFEGMSIVEKLDELQWMLDTAQEKLNDTVTAPPLMDVWFSDEQKGFAVGAFGQAFRTVNGGRTWENYAQQVSNPDGYHINAVAGTASGLVLIGGEAGFLARSIDNGKTWEKVELGYDGSVFGIVASQDGARLIATGLRGNTFLSEDQGLTWNQLNTDVDYSLYGGSLFGDSSLVLVGAGGTVVLSNDNGQSFTSTVHPTRSSMSSIVNVSGERILMVGQGGVHTLPLSQLSQSDKQ